MVLHCPTPQLPFGSRVGLAVVVAVFISIVISGLPAKADQLPAYCATRANITMPAANCSGTSVCSPLMKAILQTVNWWNGTNNTVGNSQGVAARNFFDTFAFTPMLGYTNLNTYNGKDYSTACKKITAIIDQLLLWANKTQANQMLGNATCVAPAREEMFATVIPEWGYRICDYIACGTCNATQLKPVTGCNSSASCLNPTPSTTTTTTITTTSTATCQPVCAKPYAPPLSTVNVLIYATTKERTGEYFPHGVCSCPNQPYEEAVAPASINFPGYYFLDFTCDSWESLCVRSESGEYYTPFGVDGIYDVEVFNVCDETACHAIFYLDCYTSREENVSTGVISSSNPSHVHTCDDVDTYGYPDNMTYITEWNYVPIVSLSCHGCIYNDCPQCSDYNTTDCKLDPPSLPLSSVNVIYVANASELIVYNPIAECSCQDRVSKEAIAPANPNNVTLFAAVNCSNWAASCVCDETSECYYPTSTFSAGIADFKLYTLCDAATGCHALLYLDCLPGANANHGLIGNSGHNATCADAIYSNKPTCLSEGFIRIAYFSCDSCHAYSIRTGLSAICHTLIA